MYLQKIASRIVEIREVRVMLDFDLAELYEVETKALNQAVKRNIKRFPASFMLRLTSEEWEHMRSQSVTASKLYKRNISAIPYAFTEHGVTMLASILKSDKAIKMNIAIVESFIELRKFSNDYHAISRKLQQLERKYNQQFKDVYEVLKYLLDKDRQEEEQKTRKRIGY